jgi:hypothetical protein
MLKHIAIVCPVLDDWASFITLVENLNDAFAGTEISLRILAVDDGSKRIPPAGAICLPDEGNVKEISVLCLAVNLGHQRAIAVGLARAATRGDDIDAVLVMDSDGEDRPGDAVALCQAAEKHGDTVVFARRASRTEARTFKAGYLAYKTLFRLLTGNTINFGNFSFLPIAAVRRLVLMPELWNNLPAAVIRSRVHYSSTPVNRGTRYAGRSKMNLPALIVHGMSAMSVYTDLIFVRLLMAAGLTAAVAVFGMFAVVMIRLFTNFYVMGWASTVFGDLVILLSQMAVVVIATTLLLLNSRNQRPIVPATDSSIFVMSEVRLDAKGSPLEDATVNELWVAAK